MFFTPPIVATRQAQGARKALHKPRAVEGNGGRQAGAFRRRGRRGTYPEGVKHQGPVLVYVIVRLWSEEGGHPVYALRFPQVLQLEGGGEKEWGKKEWGGKKKKKKKKKKEVKSKISCLAEFAQNRCASSLRRDESAYSPCLKRYS